MEEVDKILIHSLRQAGTAVPPEVQSVRDLTPELVVEAAVRCLRAVRPALGAPLSPLLPPGISARFRLASDLAAACQELGFGGDVGYQTFLYSSEHDTRRLLLFLVEKLPRDEGERGAETPGTDLEEGSGKSGALLRAIGARIREQLGTPWVPPVCRTPRLQRLQTPPALLETHAAQLSARHDWEAEWGGPGLASRLPPQDPQVLLQQMQAAAETLQPPKGPEEAEAEVRQCRGALGGREDALRVKARAVELLPDAQNNMAKLQLVVESSSRRIVSLAGQWERHRGPLLAEYRQLRALRDSAQVAELEALPRDVSRAVYTQRILEIVGNIRKQKEEIGKILEDTRALQKEINALVGKLERTFSVTDELLFKDAKRDEVVRKAYKYLAALHENCAQLIRTIEDTGTIQREIRDLEEQIEGETSAKLPASLERILSDCRALREENALLAARARHA
ncbi:hypothetical protein DUI87_33584 [Hirundo rustica rustica]|uniref:Coiled-coil domain-containing protein 22 n=1 Tax=Hirundo rustica rustica TaxID=333673 RepID=A0A3M0J634_HIRRU|nr:hypothetical protein DUI87_33584 [Hirundo rustica rustica]